MESFRDESGLFGLAGHRDAAHLVWLGLHALRHRGDDGVGVVCSDGQFLRAVHGRGRIDEALIPADLQELPGAIAIGQVTRDPADARAQASSARQPLLARFQLGQVGVSLAGRFTNGAALRAELQGRGAVFTSVFDAEILLHLVATSNQRTLVNRLVDALSRVQGAWAVLLCTEDRLIAVRDPHGFRPLVLGTVQGARAVASEDAPFRLLGGDVDREIRPGEMLIVDRAGTTSVAPFAGRARASCVQELIQIAAPESHAFGQPAYALRTALGERLGREQPVGDGDVVVGLPDEGVPASLGYARVVNRPWKQGLLRAGVVAAEPPQALPDFAARRQYTPVPAVISDQRVILVAASIGDGEDLRRAVGVLSRSGAKAVHVRIASPPPSAACPYGVTGPVAERLALQRAGGAVELARQLGADSIAFLSLESLHAIVGRRADGTRLFCDGCLSGSWPVAPEPPDDQLPLFDASAD